MSFVTWRGITHHDLYTKFGMYATDIPYVFSTSPYYIWNSWMINSNKAGTFRNKKVNILL
jgi:hypothetical protein